MDDGEAFDGELSVGAEELVEVRVRYKDVDASEEDEAYEVASSLEQEAVADALAGASADLQWASAVAAFAEILKQSPYAEPDQLDAIVEIVEAGAGNDADKLEFVFLLKRTRELLAAAE